MDRMVTGFYRAAARFVPPLPARPADATADHAAAR
jgi:hypothetical protein